MIAFIAAAGALGVWLIYSGITVRERVFETRVAPYVRDGRRDPPYRATGRSKIQAALLRVVARAQFGTSGALKARLKAAGLSATEEDYRLEQLTWAAGFAGAATLVPIWSWFVAKTAGAVTVAPILVVIGAVTGGLARDRYLTYQVARRRTLYIEELPVAIDLMTLSLMAGDSIAAGCKRVATAMSGGIGDEFALVWGDIRSGSTVAEALDGLSQRVVHPSMARFVDALVTGIERGAPLSDVLRAQADDTRDARRRALLEMGGRREVLMLVPVVFLILPTVVVFALWPGLVTLDLLVP